MSLMKKKFNTQIHQKTEELANKMKNKRNSQ